MDRPEVCRRMAKEITFAMMNGGEEALLRELNLMPGVLERLAAYSRVMEMPITEQALAKSAGSSAKETPGGGSELRT